MTDVRQARPADASAVASLITRFFSEEGFDGDPASLRAAADRFLSEGANAAFLAFDGPTAVGVATVTTSFGFEAGRYAEMEDLYVAPGHRGTGIATRLLEAASEWARAEGCSIVEVVVTPDGEARHRLLGWYGQRGFVDEGRRILWRRLDGV